MRLRNGVLAILAVAAFPATASAAPDFSGTLSADTPVFAWESTGSGVPLDTLGLLQELEGFSGEDVNPFGCDTDNHDCDYILLDVKHPGELTIFAEAQDGQTAGTEVPQLGYVGASFPDIDVSLYKSDSTGTPEGDSISSGCAGSNIPETCTVEAVEPGFYVVEVSFFLADEATYKADVKLKTSVAPTPAVVVETPTPADPVPAPAPQSEPAPAPQSQPAVQAAPAPAAKPVSKKAACKKKAKKIKNSKKRKKALKKCAKLR